MTDDNEPPPEVKVACEICRKEIPLSEALTDEASDYVAHFCGLDCLHDSKATDDKADT